MVAEQLGTIKIYDLRSGTSVYSMFTDEFPIQEADWNHMNKELIGCVAGRHWYVWTNTTSSMQFIKEPTNHRISKNFRWCKTNHNLFFTSGNMPFVSFCNQVRSNTPLQLTTPNNTRVDNISWMSDYPSCVTSNIDRLTIWSITNA